MGVFHTKHKKSNFATQTHKEKLIGQKIYCQCVKVSKSKGFVRFQFDKESEMAQEYGIIDHQLYCQLGIYLFVPGSYYKLKILKVNFETEIILCKGYEEEPSQCKAQDINMSSYLSTNKKEILISKASSNSDGPNLSDTISDEIIQDIFRRSLPYISDSELNESQLDEYNFSKQGESESTGSFQKTNLYPFPINHTQKCKANSI